MTELERWQAKLAFADRLCHAIQRGEPYAHLNDGALCIDGYIYGLTEAELALLREYNIAQIAVDHRIVGNPKP